MDIFMKIIKGVRFRTLGLAAIGGIVILLGVLCWEIVGVGSPPDYYAYLLFSISMLLASFSSFFVIKYKEMPRTGGLPSITGHWAVIIGISTLIISISGFFYSLYELIIHVLD
jgi:hypothetical protein